MEISIKSINQSFKDADVKAGIVTGYLSKTGNIDSDSDMIMKGAYQRTIQEWGPEGKKRIRYFLDHDATKSIGVFNVLKEDDYGLYYEAKVGDWTLAQDFLKMVDAGAIQEHSIGFKAIRQEKAEGFNKIHEIKLYEGSALQGWGANEFTPILSSKSLVDIESYFLKLQKELKDGTYSDETMIRIESYCKALEPYFKTTKPDLASENAILPDEVIDAKLKEEKKIDYKKIIETAFK